ncbi:DUF3768 domain-containing protein [Novosphingobium olei]|uniref:DUF3768 domain-containing protein n=1 Tax=Novosphingobium olei TaxID=2728851 RepID=A0A7Y0GB82_9SPHN|nr:DUF3768 domain-containing protein [Novosphingobium olei]NML96021.1 DUF3768 domain-containing protein [Novosphingobium olei]
MSDNTSPTTAQTPEHARTAQVAALNDNVRRGEDRQARIVMTRGVAELLAGTGTDEPARTARSILNQAALMRAIADADIDPGDDPAGERDFGVVTFLEQRLFWKVDYYAADGEFAYGSGAPLDPVLTTRVLTILLASEY